MTSSFAEKLCCPIDKSDLNMQVIHRHEEGEILEALLSCPECSRYYPVISGIPIMTPDEYRDKSIEAPTLKRWGFDQLLADTNSSAFLLKDPDTLSEED